MIRVTVELIPFGTGTPHRIGQMTLANDGTGTPHRGNYWARLWGKRRALGKPVRVENFPRQSKNVWHLVARVLSEGGYK